MITDITGLDSFKLSELLLKKGHEVNSIVQHHSTPCMERIDHLLIDKSNVDRLFQHYDDLMELLDLYRLTMEIKPDEVYNVTAQLNIPPFTGQAEICAPVYSFLPCIIVTENSPI